MNESEVEKIKNYILDLGSESLTVFGGRFEGGIYLQQNPKEISEILFFLKNLKRPFGSMLEVGSASGANAKVFCEILNIKDLFIIDDNRHPKHFFRKQNLNGISYKEYIGNSQSKDSKDWLSSFNKKFDIIYIDADHSYNGVKNDVKNYVDFLSDDGFMIFHDSMTTHFEGVSRLISEISSFGLKEIFSSKITLGITIVHRL